MFFDVALIHKCSVEAIHVFSLHLHVANSIELFRVIELIMPKPSCQKILCGICHKELVWRNLKLHFKNRHPDKPVIEVINYPSVQRYLREQV